MKNFRTSHSAVENGRVHFETVVLDLLFYSSATFPIAIRWSRSPAAQFHLLFPRHRNLVVSFSIGFATKSCGKDEHYLAACYAQLDDSIRTLFISVNSFKKFQLLSNTSGWLISPDVFRSYSASNASPINWLDTFKEIFNLSERWEDVVIFQKWTIHNWLKKPPSVCYLRFTCGTKHDRTW